MDTEWISFCILSRECKNIFPLQTHHTRVFILEVPLLYNLPHVVHKLAKYTVKRNCRIDKWFVTRVAKVKKTHCLFCECSHVQVDACLLKMKLHGKKYAILALFLIFQQVEPGYLGGEIHI